MTREFLSIQYLRGIAALLVVLVHVPLQLERMGYPGEWPLVLNLGVDIFFVISGFIMWTTTFDGKLTAGRFLYRRLVRIAPLYWALTGIMVGVMICAPALVQSGRLDIEHVVASLLFVAWPHPVRHGMEPVLVPGWTLNYEMMFYVLFATCLPLAAAWRWKAIIAALVGLVGLQVLFPEPHTVGAFYTSSIMLEFGFGILLGVCVTSSPGRADRARSGGVPALGLAFAAVLMGAAAAIALAPLVEWPRVAIAGLPAAVIVTGAVMAEQWRAMRPIRALRALGDASYSLYLSHGIVLSAFGQLWRKLGAGSLPANPLLFTLAALAVAIAVAMLLFRFVEQPLIRTFRARREPPRDGAVLPAGLATPFAG